jgi:hypothetical protein
MNLLVATSDGVTDGLNDVMPSYLKARKRADQVLIKSKIRHRSQGQPDKVGPAADSFGVGQSRSRSWLTIERCRSSSGALEGFDR